jgi:arylsulfatase A-like enzyme
MKRLTFLLFACWPALVLAQPPNILLLMAEDMSPRVGAFGDDVAVTPNIDELARGGVRYSRAFTTAGVCAPSRAAMVLGVHQIATGTQHMRTATRPDGGYFAVPPVEMKAFPELLRQAGYYTYTDRKLDYQFSHGGAGSGPFTVWDAENVGAEGWRDRDPGQPFFGHRNFLVSHESGVFEPLGHWPASWGHFQQQVVRWLVFGSVDEVVAPEDVVLPPYYPDTPTVRADLARHYDNIAAMDREVGEILAQLEADGLADSTVVIWTSDHGDGLPRAKRELHDSGIHVPLVIRWPEALRPAGLESGSLDTRLVSAIDLAPTILALAGVEIPEYVQGRNLLESERSYVFAARDRVDGVADRQRAVRDARFKYIRSWRPDLPEGHRLAYRDDMAMVAELRALHEAGDLDETQARWFEPVGVERLYDLDADPHEVDDVAADPRYAGELTRLRGALDDWLVGIDDLGEIPEARLVERFATWPAQPVTPAPIVSLEGCSLMLEPDAPGSSLGYRRENEARWRLYVDVLDHCAHPVAEVRAVRYGWQASSAVSIGGD